jgi:hypothetical protein
MPTSTPTTPLVRFQVEIPTRLKLKLRQAALARNCSLSALLHFFLRRGVQHRSAAQASKPTPAHRT